MEQEAHRRVEDSHPQETRKLSQETKVILATATPIIVLLLGLLVTSVLTSARIEARLDRVSARIEARLDRVSARTEARIDQAQAEARSDREAWQAEMRAARAEVRADREAWQAEMRAARAEAKAGREELRAEAKADRQGFQRQILRITEEQVRTAAVVEQMQATSR